MIENTLRKIAVLIFFVPIFGEWSWAGRKISFVSLVDVISNTNMCWADLVLTNVSNINQRVKITGLVSRPAFRQPTGLTSLVSGAGYVAFAKTWTTVGVTTDPTDSSYFVMAPGSVLISEARPTDATEKCVAEGEINVKEDIGGLLGDGIFYLPTHGREIGTAMNLNSGRPF